MTVIVGQMISLFVTATPVPGNLSWQAPNLPGQVVQNYTQTVHAGAVTPYVAGGGYTSNWISFAWMAAAAGSGGSEGDRSGIDKIGHL